MTLYCEEYEKNLFEGYASKVLMNGQVPRWEDEKMHDSIWTKADKIFDIFYDGQPQTVFEQDI